MARIKDNIKSLLEKVNKKLPEIRANIGGKFKVIGEKTKNRFSKNKARIESGFKSFVESAKKSFAETQKQIDEEKEAKSWITSEYLEKNGVLIGLIIVPYHILFFWLIMIQPITHTIKTMYSIHGLQESFNYIFNITVNPGIASYGYFMLGHAVAVILLFAFGSKVTATLRGARDVTRFLNDEKYIYDLFRDVYRSSKILNPNLSDNIKLYIIDDQEINAYVYNNALFLNKGLINGLSVDELRGILAHEIGHISNNYSKFILFVKGSTFIIPALVFSYELLKNTFLSFLATPLAFLPAYILKLVGAPCFRENEIFADEFATKLGYGEDLKSALNMTYQLELMRKQTFMDRVMDTHPPTAIRIWKIEENIRVEMRLAEIKTLSEKISNPVNDDTDDL